MFFHVFFIVASAIAVALFIYSKSKVESCPDPTFSAFQRSYIVIYALAVAGDWLQGPHVYALYDSYGMSKHQIELLFIAGFGSSLVFGTVIGSFADKFGRRNNCFLYGVLYGISCLTKHVPVMEVLMIGRFLGGIATSILFSAFESWLMYEHNKRGFSDDKLGVVFSNAALANSLIAIASGYVAQAAADLFGFVAPFDVALLVLGTMSVLVLSRWPENYGDERATTTQSFQKAWGLITSDYRVLCLGLVQALFEGAMYTFVLEWTPALTQAAPIGASLPHGVIFAAFMIAAAAGSSLFKILTKWTRVENLMRYVLLVSSMCLSMPLVFPFNLTIVFVAFLVFEMCVGIFWPSMACLRGAYLPEETRSTTINMFRIPLNLIVIVILYQNFSMHTIFQCCAGFLLLAAGAQHILYRQEVGKQE
ncbi:samt-1 [Pristionchus pacificus]|uniref:Samt-1 n=1 Tax=Pristionchus pacificus TaxID=54126 RepID=A0A2A6BYI3_PRIPA|nr:samt-1 [Pristionchus pacificus]|eukprot:PDM70833.1 samt-1 [Pristionchus pacificus]